MTTVELSYKKILFWSLFGATTVAAALVFWPFLSALLWAVVLAILMWPFYRRLQAKFSKNFSALMATMVTAVVIVLPFAGIGTIVGIQVYHFANQLIQQRDPGQKSVTVEEIATKADELLRPILSQVGLGEIDVKEYIDTHRSDLTAAVRGPLAKLVSSLGFTILTLVFALMTMFFMLRDGPKLLDPIAELVPLPRDETIKILVKMQSTVQSAFVGVVLVSIIQEVIAGGTDWVLGVPAPLLWAFVTFVFCTVPMLGGPVIYVPLAIKLVVDGRIPQALILLVVGFGVISTVDNFLRPVFIGARSDLHPMAIFFSLLGGVLVMGPIGLMAGPLVLTLLFGLTDVLRAMRRVEEDALLNGAPLA